MGLWSSSGDIVRPKMAIFVSICVYQCISLRAYYRSILKLQSGSHICLGCLVNSLNLSFRPFLSSAVWCTLRIKLTKIKEKTVPLFSTSTLLHYWFYRRSYLIPTYLVPTHLVSTFSQLLLPFTHNLL